MKIYCLENKEIHEKENCYSNPLNVIYNYNNRNSTFFIVDEDKYYFYNEELNYCIMPLDKDSYYLGNLGHIDINGNVDDEYLFNLKCDVCDLMKIADDETIWRNMEKLNEFLRYFHDSTKEIIKNYSIKRHIKSARNLYVDDA